MKIIAEVGSNWETFEDCKDSIQMAKTVGADIVKFQMFSWKEMYGFGDGELRGGIPAEWLPKLKQKADDTGIDFMCTAFSPEGVKVVDKYVKTHKVASSDLTHKRLLEAVKDTGKRVLLSTGASSLADIEMALKVLEGSKVAILYCVSSYPAKWTDLTKIAELSELFKVPVGFSDHSTDILEIPNAAMNYTGVVVLEKHFKLRDMDTPDNGHSLNPEEFKAMVDKINGRPYKRASDEEKPMYLRHNRRLIATQDLPQGAVLREGKNFGAFRSLKDDTNGGNALKIDKFNGKMIKRSIKQGEGISPSDLMKD